MRRKLVVGNWKLNGSLKTNELLIAGLIAKLKPYHAADFAVCAPFTYLFQAQALLTGSNIAWGAQNASQFESGAHTSSISASMIAEFGCQYVIIGHSERRTLSNESNQKAARRIARVVEASLTPIYCVGGTLEELNDGLSENVVKNQILAITHGLDDAVFEQAKKVNMVIAYEPVWAIGKNQAATPSQVQDMHLFIRNLIAKVDTNYAKKIRIIYGGSLTPANAGDLFSMPDVDGGLVGRCALSADEFSKICIEACKVNQACLVD
ncbi:MAG: triose-phosphate isomerase [Methylophilaceae bacterium]